MEESNMDRAQTIQEIQTIMPLTKRMMHTRLHNILAQYDLSYAQFELIFALQAADDHTTKGLAEQLHLTPGAVSQLIESLAQRSYVERSTDENDRRITHLALTKSGKTMAKKIESSKHGLIRDIMESLSDEELTLMLQIQRKIAEQLQQGQKGTE